MSVLVFDVHASIHFQEIRTSIIRIPEVIQKIRQVQNLLDQKGIALDLSNFIASDDSTFLHHYRRKEFAAVVLQLGLYDRYVRYYESPNSVVGVVNSISAVRVISGQMTLGQLVDEAFKKAKTQEPGELPGLPVLTGIQIPKYQLFGKRVAPEGEIYKEEGLERADLNALIASLAADSVYEVGVGSFTQKGTIELDPQLSWVWEQLEVDRSLAAAN